jgi:hypothetical protein
MHIVERRGEERLTALWHLHEEEFLAFLWFRDMGRDERVLSMKESKQVSQ